MLIDNSKLNNEQYSVLINEYKAIQVDKDHLGVLFKTTGSWDTSWPEELSPQYRLERPFVVSINDKTVKITELGAWVIIALLPLVVIIDCIQKAPVPCGM